MSLRVGDTVFSSNGSAAIAVGRDATNGTVILDRSQEAVRMNTRHGYINGIAPEKRHEFLTIMDEVKKFERPEQRVEMLQSKIDELSSDPRNMQFVKYLESERNHIINMSGYKPRLYATQEHKLR